MRKTTSPLVSVLLAAGCLAGCTTAADIAGMRPASISKRTTSERIQTLQARYDPDVVARCKTLPDSQRTACRDDIVLAELTASDLAFEDFEWAAWGSNAGFSTLTDFAVLGLTAAGGLSPAGVAQALSATAAAVTGAKTSVEKNFLYAKTVDQLIFSMSVTRSQIRNHIVTCLALPASQYDVSMAVYDALQYQNAGTLPSAIANLTSTATGNGMPTTCGTVPIPTISATSGSGPTRAVH